MRWGECSWMPLWCILPSLTLTLPPSSIQKLSQPLIYLLKGFCYLSTMTWKSTELEIEPTSV
jgi:hypothetical protein